MAGFSNRERLVLIGCDSVEAVHDWLRLSQGYERQERWLSAFVHMCFPLSGGIMSPVVVP